jgi:ADP-ribose pyrophosphatase
VMVKQYRYLRDEESLEFPCGGVKAGSSYLTSAHQELQEESGYSAAEMVQVGEFNPYNGVTNEMCRVYVARGLKLVGTNPDPTEEFEHFALTPDEIDKRILSGEIWDGMSIAAWFIGRPKII